MADKKDKEFSIQDIRQCRDNILSKRDREEKDLIERGKRIFEKIMHENTEEIIKKLPARIKEAADSGHSNCKVDPPRQVGGC